jgi:hypothetical protein
MSKLGKYLTIFIGGFLLMMILGMIISAVFGVSENELNEFNLIEAWFFYRIGFYCMLMSCWIPACNFITRSSASKNMLSETERLRAFSYMKNQWWKLALLFAFFEVVIIQQFGL